MDTLLQDIRFAARQLAKHPGFTTIALLTLSLGIGTTTTCFSLLNAFALAPLPFEAPERLMSVMAIEQPAGTRSAIPLDTFAALEHAPELFAGAVAYSPRAVTVAGSAAAERVNAAEVSGDLFALLGVPLQRGGWPPEGGAGSRTAVISDALWTRRFASDPGILGSSLMLDGEIYTIAGVAAPGFSFPRGADVWFPATARGADARVDVVARLSPGVGPGQADAALRSFTIRGRSEQHATAAAVPLRETMVGSKHRNATLALLVASSLVLAVACANLAGLLLARLAARKHEIAVRSAIGASRVRLVRQLMTESLMLSLAGGALGALVAQWGVDLFVATLGKPRELEWLDFAVDLRVLAFALATSAGAALLFGVVPALQGARVDVRGALQEDRGPAGSGRRTRRGRGVVVALQVALSLTLVAGASSVVMSSMSLDRIEPGFDRDRLLAVRATLAGTRFDAPAQRMAFVDGAVERLRALPGVVAVTAVSHVPVGDRDVPFWRFAMAGAADGAPGAGQLASVRFADTGYLETMGIPVRLGRGFTRAEARDVHAPVILINNGMAGRLWPGRNPIGSRLRLPGTDTPDAWYTIVGIVGDVAQRQLPAAPENQIYLPLAHARDITLVVRTTVADPGSLAAAARDAIRGADSTVAVSTRTMADMYQWYTNDRRGQGLVLAALGVMALLIAALGVFGVMALMVTERRGEIAIRKALGGSDSAVRRLVLGRGLRLASVGIGAGLLLAALLTAFLSSIFYGVRPFDVRVLGGTAALLGVVATAASWWPASSAMRIDPMEVLKQ